MNIVKLCNDIADEIESCGHYQANRYDGGTDGVCILTSDAFANEECANSEPGYVSRKVCEALGLFRPEVNYSPAILIAEFNDNNETEVVLEALRSV